MKKISKKDIENIITIICVIVAMICAHLIHDIAAAFVGIVN